MAPILTLLLSFVAGIILRRLPRSAPNGYHAINSWILNVALPALVLNAIHRITIRPHHILGASFFWFAFVLSASIAYLSYRRGWLSRQAAGCVGLCCGLGNTAFLGIPVMEAIGGPATAAPAVLADQLGVLPSLSFMAIPYALFMSGRNVSAKAILLRALTFPPFIALILALSTGGLPYPEPLVEALSRISATMTPLALASIGWQLNISSVRSYTKHIFLALGYKLALIPAVFIGVLLLGHYPFDLDQRVVIGQLGTPPMVTCAILASELDLEPQLAATLVGVGVLVGPLVMASFWWLTGHL